MRSFIVLIALITSSAFALEGELVPQVNRTLDLEEGSLFDGVLRLWPVSESWDKSQLEALAGKNIGEAFNLVRIDTVERSTHNAEVIELRGLFALIKAVSPKTKVSLSLKGAVVPLEIRRLNMIATAPVAQQFELVEQPDVQGSFESGRSIVLVVAAAGILSLLAFGGMKLRKARRLKLMKLKAKAEIVGAKTRVEIERIGKRINEHQALLNLPKERMLEFKQRLDLYQYRPTWTDEQLADVRKSLESLINDR